LSISNGPRALFELVRFIALVISSIVTFGEGAALSPYKRVFISKKSAAEREKKDFAFKTFIFF